MLNSGTKFVVFGDHIGDCALSLAVDSSCSEPQETFLDCNLRRDEGLGFRGIEYSPCESHCFGEVSLPSNTWGQTDWELSSQHTFFEAIQGFDTSRTPQPSVSHSHSRGGCGASWPATSRELAKILQLT